MGFETFWPVLVLLAIAGVTIAVYRLRSSVKENAVNEGHLQDRQNSLYDLSAELAGLSASINNGHARAAYRDFVNISKRVNAFKHEQFPSIEWKTYYENVVKSRNEFRQYFEDNYSDIKREFERGLANEEQKSKIEAEKQEAITNKVFIGICAFMFIGALAAVVWGNIASTKKKDAAQTVWRVDETPNENLKGEAVILPDGSRQWQVGVDKAPTESLK